MTKGSFAEAWGLSCWVWQGMWPWRTMAHWDAAAYSYQLRYRLWMVAADSQQYSGSWFSGVALCFVRQVAQLEGHRQGQGYEPLSCTGWRGLEPQAWEAWYGSPVVDEVVQI